MSFPFKNGTVHLRRYTLKVPIKINSSDLHVMVRFEMTVHCAIESIRICEPFIFFIQFSVVGMEIFLKSLNLTASLMESLVCVIQTLPAHRSRTWHCLHYARSKVWFYCPTSMQCDRVFAPLPLQVTIRRACGT